MSVKMISDRAVVCADHQRGLDLAGGGQQHADQMLPRGAVELAGRFISQYESRPLREHSSDRDSLTLTPRQLLGKLSSEIVHPHRG
jgi:hypothetical protein